MDSSSPYSSETGFKAGITNFFCEVSLIGGIITNLGLVSTATHTVEEKIRMVFPSFKHELPSCLSLFSANPVTTGMV